MVSVRRLVAAAVGVGFLATGATAQNAVQWRVEDGGNGHWYAYVRDMSIGWQSAAAAATASGGYLACITTPNENAFVFSYLNSASAWVDVRGPFLGGYQDRSASDYSEPSGGWRWISGEPWLPDNWSAYGFGEPNNDFGVEDVLAIDNRSGSSVWNDVALNGHAGGQSSAYRTSTGYLIEWSADCNNDGLVDYGQIQSGQLADANGNNIPDCCENGTSCNCPGDTNSDRRVDGVDLAMVLTRRGMSGAKFPQADCNRDGVIDGVDLAIVLAGWGGCPTNLPAWATVLEAAPNPQVVTNASLRAAIGATSLAWRVRDNATGIEMLLVPPGTFQMGSSPGDPPGFPDEQPVRSITITRAFYLARFETTQSQWQAIMGSNPSYFQGPAYPNSNLRPVDQVTWNAIQAFLASTGMRLPTGAEWEFACRAGTTTPTYATNGQTLADIAWYSANSAGQTQVVGQKAANALGLHDMLGNVWEWTADWYGPYSPGPQTDPTGPTSGTERELRGSTWLNGDSYCRVSKRGGYWPNSTQNLFGFRVARNP